MPVLPTILASAFASLTLLMGVFPKLNLVDGYHQGFLIPTIPTAPTVPPKPTYNLPYSTPTPTTKPTATPTPTTFIKPTSTPTPTRALQPTFTPTPTIYRLPTTTPTLRPPTPTPTSTANLSQRDIMMRQINDYRRSQGLSEIRTDSYTCSFAATRAREISTSFNHDGFSNRINSKTLPYPSYSYIVENIALNSSYQNVVPAWINSSGHAANLRTNTSYGCVESYGNYYAFEGWKP